MSLGVRRFATREIARDKDRVNKYLGTILFLKLPAGVLSFIIGFIIIISSKFQAITQYTLIWILLATFIGIMRDEMYAIAQAFERMEFEAAGKVIASILLLGSVLLFIHIGKGVVWIASLYFIINLLLFIYIFLIVLWLYGKPDFTIDKHFIVWTLKESIPFGLSSLFYAVYFYIDSVMLSYMKGSASVGFYNAAYKLVFVLIFIPSAYLRAIYPVISRYYVNAKNALAQVYKLNLKYFLILAIFTGMVIYAYAYPIIKIIYGTSYLPSIPALKILGIAIAFSFLAYNASNTLDAMNRQRINFFITMSLMFLNAGLNFIFIPQFGFIGASFTTLITEFTSFLILSLIIQYIVHFPLSPSILFRIILSAGISIPILHYNIRFYAPFVFLILLLIFRVFGSEDTKLLSRVIRKNG